MAKQNKNNQASALRSNIGQDGFIERNLDKLEVLRSWFLWFPDLAFDLMSPVLGSMKLCFDQRVAMRSDSRFQSLHVCFPRGSSKTFSQVWVSFVDSIVLPSIEIALSAQTKENASELLNDKYNELMRWIPALQNEIMKYSHKQNDTEILFRNNSRLDKLMSLCVATHIENCVNLFIWGVAIAANGETLNYSA